MIKKIIASALDRLGLQVRRIRPSLAFDVSSIPEGELYRPLFSPWLAKGDFRPYYDLAAPKTLVSPDRCYVLYTLVRQALNISGDVWECGVYKGGTAAMIAALLSDTKSSKRLYLFDTFEGMPETDPEKDLHKKGDFLDTSLEAVTQYIGHDNLCVVRKGFIPDTFIGLESEKIALAHIDVDIYKSILDCLNFIWPRLSTGGFIVFDDYGFPSCPGARAAVDDFFRSEICIPLCLSTGQALVFKSKA
ncbi:macrocin-O-methyltransferase TylF [Prosthecobacter fusiformis]|uniref:Macrocin-O-methyltransferase TylF n=1 Tax=Prosthecobacter fusiformis TaxID=48464 RepID=A0A4R7RZV0_9BACT|nr:TylF/MycF/NovP-related O-methyltransferase [Prosthecobacter fusiformis]TDU71411.1 macrocin-O-methyltransferase TylF [Prosthecobacter fusiformis]